MTAVDPHLWIIIFLFLTSLVCKIGYNFDISKEPLLLVLLLALRGGSVADALKLVIPSNKAGGEPATLTQSTTSGEASTLTATMTDAAGKQNKLVATKE